MTGNQELDFWNTRFSEQSYLFGTEPNAFLSSQRARLRPGMRALAIADGEGRNGVWLAKQWLDVLSVDFSPVALKKAGCRSALGFNADRHTNSLCQMAWAGSLQHAD